MKIYQGDTLKIDLERAIEFFQLKGFCIVPRGKVREEFEDKITSLGLNYSKRIDTHWECWIFENKEGIIN